MTRFRAREGRALSRRALWIALRACLVGSAIAPEIARADEQTPQSASPANQGASPAESPASAPPSTSGPAATPPFGSGSASPSAAQSAPPPEAKGGERPPPRPVPEYRGQEPPAPSAGEVLIWIPRVILLPAYLVTEYVVRAPVGAVATAAEKGNWGPAVFNFFAFGPDHKGGIFPTFLINFGFRPSIGLHFFWNDTFVTGNKVTADAAWGGSNWITLGLGDRYYFTKDSSLALEGHWNRRPDNLYYGIGPETTTDFKSRYGTDVVGGSLSYRYTAKAARLEAGAHLTRTVFRDYSCCSDPTLAQRVEAGELPAPPGFEENTTAAGLTFRASFDTRAPDIQRSGIRVGVAVAPSVDVTRGFDRSWIQYGAGVEGSWDVTGKGRVLSLGVLAEFADPLGSQPVPFTDLVTVGGAEPFVGFLRGRLRDRSAIGAQLSWRWPVFAYLDGVAGVAFGNVFDTHLSNFRWDLLRLSAELGVRTAAALGASNFQFVIGIGTEPFNQGLRLTSFSLVFGVTYAL
ncbi:MAG TPA: hypothetical protein VGG91_18840 [Myxococcaceae bacterium]